MCVVLQCAAVCCSVLQRVAACCCVMCCDMCVQKTVNVKICVVLPHERVIVLESEEESEGSMCCSVLQCVAVFQYVSCSVSICCVCCSI